MESGRICELLTPFTSSGMPESQAAAFSAYLDLLTRWNERVNLTAVRSPEEIVRRHFGESIFAAERLLVAGESPEVCDLGSGAGFPGLPLKIVRPSAHITLVEAHGKKSIFLKEVIRALHLTGIEVLPARAETLRRDFDIVTLRAVERFSEIVGTAGKLTRQSGRLALLIGSSQIDEAERLLPNFVWQPAIPIPQSEMRVLLEGIRK